MRKDNTQKVQTQAKAKVKPLFIEDMARVQGGTAVMMPPNTTLACCEEVGDPCCAVE